MKTLFFSLLLVFSFPLLADSDPSYPPNPYDTAGGNKGAAFTAASPEASHWIALIDQAQYGASWLDAGPLFRDIIAQDQWVAAMTATRRPLGGVRARKTNGYTVAETLPGGTKGYFIIISYATDFSERSGVTERLVLMRIQNDQWRVISYTFQK